MLLNTAPPLNRKKTLSIVEDEELVQSLQNLNVEHTALIVRLSITINSTNGSLIFIVLIRRRHT